MAHLLVSLSAHGFGHIGQTAPVVRELLSRNPSLTVTLRTAAPAYKLAEHMGRELPLQPVPVDVGMIQATALDLDLEKTAAAYVAFHRDWTDRVEQTAEQLRAARPDLVLSNVSYLALAAAKLAEIPALVLGNINWAVIYGHLLAATQPDSPAILRQMLAAYNSALAFMQPAPSMVMTGLENAVPIGPIAKIGQSHQSVIIERLGLSSGTKLVLMSLGGMEYRPPVESWPRLPGIHMLIPESWNARHPDMTPLESLDLPFLDLLASSHALIAKPGYGSFVESACNGIPVAYLPRHNWPETPCLTSWLEEHGRLVQLDKDRFIAGRILDSMEELWAMDPPVRPEPTGIRQAALLIEQALNGTLSSLQQDP